MTFEALLAEPPPMPTPADATHRRREAFRQANASLALEGLIMTAEDLALQEQVITGVLSTDQASALLAARYRQPSGTATAIVVDDINNHAEELPPLPRRKQDQ